ncbi:MAG: hypothetical protein ACREBR_03665 [bacterium]
MWCYIAFYVAARFGHAPAPFDGRTFALLGDIRDVDLFTVEWPAGAFLTTNEVIVPNVAEVEVLMAANPGDTIFGPFARAGPNYETVRTRNVMYIPPKYVQLILNSRCTPRDLWERVGRNILADGNAADCTSLINWLRVALVRQGPAPANSEIVLPPQAPVLGDIELSAMRAHYIKLDLPHRFPPQPGMRQMEPTESITAALGEIRRDMHVHREEERAIKEGAKLPSKRWKRTLHILLRVCQLDSEENLPPVRHDLADSTTKEDRRVIQSHLDTRAREPTAATAIEPIATPAIAKRLVSFMFSARDRDDLEDGIQPFVTSYRTPQQVAEEHQLAQDYDTVMEGSTSMTMADVNIVRTKSQVPLPSNLFKATTSANIYATVIEVCLGLNHPLCQVYRAFLREWNKEAPTLEVNCTFDPLYPAKLLRAVQLQLVEWFDQQEKTDESVQPPHLTKMFNKIRMHLWMPPMLPPRIVGAIMDIRSTPSMLTTIKAHRAAGTAPCVVSILTEKTSKALKQNTTTTSNKSGKVSTFVRNPSVKSDLQVSTALRLKSFTDQHEPPKNGQGDAMCIAYHCKGSCYSTCKRGQDHRAHTPAEDAALLAWKKRHIDKEAGES